MLLSEGLIDEAQLERARPIVERSEHAYANLVFRRDKALLFSRAGNALLMYGRRGRSRIAMGDPVGPAAELGEEARVELRRFDLDVSAHRRLRQARAKLARAGYRFEILPPEAVPAALPALARVSQSWLAGKATREKGFSNASFDGQYLARFPVAVVRRNGEIVAFANLWMGANREELSVDLMRHHAEAPNGTMDLVFTELLLWGRQQGYRWFNFGMAPLSGLNRRKGAPLWNHVGTFVYEHGEHFYNFRGLRSYKEKFQPVWTPLYLASPGGMALPVALLDVTALIAGGLRRIVS